MLKAVWLNVRPLADPLPALLPRDEGALVLHAGGMGHALQDLEGAAPVGAVPRSPLRDLSGMRLEQHDRINKHLQAKGLAYSIQRCHVLRP